MTSQFVVQVICWWRQATDHYLNQWGLWCHMASTRNVLHNIVSVWLIWKWGKFITVAYLWWLSSIRLPTNFGDDIQPKLQYATKGVHLFTTACWTSQHDDVIKWKYFRVTGPLCGEFTGHRWMPHTEASDAELWCFFDLRLNKRLSKQSWGWWSETPSRSLWRHSNGRVFLICHSKDRWYLYWIYRVNDNLYH